MKYYVELDPQVPRIPLAAEGKKEKDTSRLVNASPRDDMSLPDDIYVVTEIPQADTPAEIEPDNVPVSIFEKTRKKEPLPPAVTPLPVPEESPVMKPEASEAIHALFAPKVDILHPPEDKPEKKPVEKPEKEPAVVQEEKPAPRNAGLTKAVPPGEAKKKRSLKWPAAIAIVIVLIAVSIAGVYVVRPGAFDGLRSLYAHPTATPQPTPTPTAEPTPVPTAAPEQPATFDEVSSLIDPDNPVVLAFARAHTNESSNDTVMQACDLFTYVNDRWNYSENYTQPRKASDIAGTLEGTQKDYTVLMHSLMQSIHIDSRVVFSYSGDLLRYYPEVLATNTSSGYTAVVQELNTRYGAASPKGHSDDTGYWIALGMGDLPGDRPDGATLEYALYNGMIGPIKAS